MNLKVVFLNFFKMLQVVLLSFVLQSAAVLAWKIKFPTKLYVNAGESFQLRCKARHTASTKVFSNQHFFLNCETDFQIFARL